MTEAIRAARASYNRAIVDRNAEAIVGHLTEDYQLRASNGLELSGRPSLLQHWRHRFKSDAQAMYMRSPRDIIVGQDGTCAEESGDWTGRWCGPTSYIVGSGTYTAEWILQADGQWRVASEHFEQGRVDPPMKTQPGNAPVGKVAVIGAGCSGLAAIKNLLEAGVTSVTCFEQQDRIGGNWAYSEQESHSSVCETTHIISSKALSGFIDYPMPEHYPDYPSHQQVLAYFESYADHFGLRDHIRLGTRVTHAEPDTAGRWTLTLADGTREVFDWLLVTSGHHSVPRHPDWKDDFSGRYLHAHQFKHNRGFKGQRVLVVGAGNSGCDCAVEISRVAAFTAISIRTPQYIVPKFFMGKPVDVFNARLQWLPRFILSPMRKLALRLQLGRYEDYGLETPSHDIIAAHPTVNSELLDRIRHGEVHPRRGVVRVEGRTVHFADDTREEYDTIVAATGYRMATPFFDKSLLDYSDAERIPLWLRMFHPQLSTLMFIGLVQPQGAIWPLSDRQARIAAAYISGYWKLPDDVAERAEAEADRIEREFLKSPRHAVEVDYHRFARELERVFARSAQA